jgi:hypothetical protein
MNVTFHPRQKTMTHRCSEVVVNVETHYTPKNQCKHDPAKVKRTRVARVKSVSNEDQTSYNCFSCGRYYWGCSGGIVIYCYNATHPEDQKRFMVCDEKVCYHLFDEATDYDETFFAYADTSEWYKLECTGGPEGN